MEKYQIPCNPEYDWNLTPEEQADYVNPVELNNKLIEFQNEHARVAALVVAEQRRRAQLKVNLREAEHKLTKLRTKLLRLHPPPAVDRKTNILLESYVDRIAFEAGYEATWDKHQQQVRTIENDIEVVDAEIEANKMITFMLKEFYENIKTHLAFRKHEWRQIMGNPGA